MMVVALQVTGRLLGVVVVDVAAGGACRV